MSDKPKLAKEIRVTQRGTRNMSITVDGAEFPWYFSVDGIHTTVSKGDLPAVTITIVAERLLVDHGLDA